VIDYITFDRSSDKIIGIALPREHGTNYHSTGPSADVYLIFTISDATGSSVDEFWPLYNVSTTLPYDLPVFAVAHRIANPAGNIRKFLGMVSKNREDGDNVCCTYVYFAESK
jgi:hypothetical protein